MAPPRDLQPHENGGFFSSYQLLTLYFPAFVFALGYSIATPAIPVLAKSFDTGFGVASLVIVVHALGALLATVPTGFLVDRMGRPPDSHRRAVAHGGVVLSDRRGALLR